MPYAKHINSVSSDKKGTKQDYKIDNNNLPHAIRSMTTGVSITNYYLPGA
jgi:hypothetical protein